MPYRRLPNTDAARLKALKKANEKGKELPPFKLAYTQNSFHRVQAFVSSFEKVMLEYKKSYENQIEKNKDYLQTLKKVKLYVSHFIQVMNLAILRGDLPRSDRKYYGLEEDDKRIPALNTEADVILWGENIINGEEVRKMKNLTLITNPTIAVVKVRYENFMDSYTFQKTLQKNNHRALQELAELRDEADDIILSIWNEVEKTFHELPESERREKAIEYGLTYVFRKNEMAKIDLFNEAESRIGKLF